MEKNNFRLKKVSLDAGRKHLGLFLSKESPRAGTFVFPGSKAHPSSDRVLGKAELFDLFFKKKSLKMSPVWPILPNWP